MGWYTHIDGEGRIDGMMPETVTVQEFDYETMEHVEVQRRNISDESLKLGWFEWPFGEPIPERYWEYAIRDGNLVHIGPPPPTEEELRASEVNEAHDDLPEIQEGLMEVARMSADHETSIEDLENAIIELAALIGG